MQFLSSIDILPNLCIPAKFFVVFESIRVLFRTFFPKKERPLLSHVKIFILYALLIVGWTTVINYSCDSADNHLAWVLALIPTFIGMLVWKK
jgi:hypothetical protein